MPCHGTCSLEPFGPSPIGLQILNKRNRLQGVIQKLVRLFSSYPNEPGVVPRSFDCLKVKPGSDMVYGVLAFQSVPDRFYFLLLGAIRSKLARHFIGPTELVVVRAINGAVGTGLLAELKRSAPISWLIGRQWERAYGKLVDSIAYRCATWRFPFADYLDWMKSKSLWLEMQKQGEPRSMQIDGVEVVDLVIDSYLRFKPAPEFDPYDHFVRRLIWQALRNVRQANSYFSRVRPRWYLTSYSTYLEHGIPVRSALRHGVAVWSFVSITHFAKKLTQADPFHTPDYSRYSVEFDALDGQAQRLEVARSQLEHRLSGGIDMATSYMRQSAYAQKRVPLPDGLNGAVVIFLHDFYDSPHIYPDMIFDDFWRWICFTIDVLQRSGINFFLKPHPNQVALSEDALQLLRQKYPSLQWLSTSDSNVQLAQVGIACGVTVYGTVAHELAYLGVPSIGCARHPHHTFDFCRTAKTRDEYEGMLQTYAVSPLPKEEMQRQALAFYYMHNLFMTGEQQELRHAFLSLWTACHQKEVTEEQVMSQLQAMAVLPEFDRFVEVLVRSDAGLG